MEIGVKIRNASAAIVVAFVCTTHAASAADDPSRPLRFLVGFPAGGGLDISCRYWGQRLAARTGQQVIVDNRPGAASEIAVRMAMSANPDGHTLLCASASATILSSKPNPPFDLRTGVAPVIQMTQFTFVLFVTPGMPAKSVGELIAYAKARPGKLNYSSAGAGSTTHLAMELLKLAADIDVTHVPFKGAAQSSTAVISGDIQIGVDSLASVKPHFDAGRLRPVGVFSAERSRTLPGVEGMREAGIPGINVIGWSGLVAPAKTPGHLIGVLNAHLNAVLEEAEVKSFFLNQGFETAGGTSQAFGRLIAEEVATWSKVIQAAKIQFD